MKDQQIIALANPCEFAEQCADQRYRTIQQRGLTLFSVMLTVNVGEE